MSGEQRTTQLRIYSIRPGLLDAWMERWTRLIVPLRRELGFEIQASWVDRERSEHIWVLSHPGDGAAFARANAAYWDSPRRASLGVDPGGYLVGEVVRQVDPVPLP